MFLGLELAQCTLLVFIFICNCHMNSSFYGLGNSLLCKCLSCVLCMGWVGGRVAGLGFVCNLLGMVLGILFPLELFMTSRFSLSAWYM